MNLADQNWLWRSWLNSIPPAPVKSVVQWAVDAKIDLISGSRGKFYDPSITPWTTPIIEHANDGTRKCSLAKPTQTGGSVVGEIVLLFWLSMWSSGDIAYYWPNQLAADARWKKRFEKMLRACDKVMNRMASADRYDWNKSLVVFPHCNFEMLGVNSERSVASSSFRGEVNEELHVIENGWTDGKLNQVYGRQGAFFAPVAFNISNAGFVNSEWHKEWKSGTCQLWEVKCPGCGLYHVMHTDRDRNTGAGLRYDATGARLENMEYNYNRIMEKGIHYQFECGYKLHDDVTARKNLSKSGRYSDPTNANALLSNRSYIYEAVACDTVNWLELIQQKHTAYRTGKVTGNWKPWFDYLRERECKFVDIGKDRPAPERIEIVTSGRKKNREGLPNHDYRFAFADWQRGREGQPPHFWLLIQDWMNDGNSLIVYEGRVDTEGELVAILKEHEVKPICTTIDSSWDTVNIYALCLRRGFNAVKADDKNYWPWEDGTQRFYAEPRPLFTVANSVPCQLEDPSAEPDFFLYSKYVSMERLIYLRQSKEMKYEIPADVSEDFVNQFDSWSMEVIRQKDGQVKMKWQQKRDDDHLFQCAAGILPMVDLIGIFTVGPQPPVLAPVSQSEPEGVTNEN